MGGPAVISNEGLFDGGVRYLEGTRPADKVLLQVSIFDPSGIDGVEFVGVSDPFSVVLGDGESNPATLSTLTGLSFASNDDLSESYYWEKEWFSGVWFCRERSNALAIIRVDPCLCKEEPLPSGLEEVPECLYELGSNGLAIWVSEDGFFELRWREGQLYESKTLQRSSGQRVKVLTGSGLGYSHYRTPVTAENKFFWLEQD